MPKIAHMLKFDAAKRPSSLEAMKHKYLVGLAGDDSYDKTKPPDPSEFEFERRKLDAQAQCAPKHRSE